uniref:LAGLIDADG endonuclease n=1 Tax=Sclerotinia borealis TaxID=77105 RepID=A0A088CAJ8_9HELO|nr:LAGLIDADG endonuclease [Sclerotinia borealis]AHX82997.1 LAGLIDADG endonuclease [Sclerotinia borealis]
MNKSRTLDDQGLEETLLYSNPSSITKPNLSYDVGAEPKGSKTPGFINKRHYSSCAIISGPGVDGRPSDVSLVQPTKEGALFDKQDKFSEWLAGVIDGDGQFKTTKKGISSLQIVMDINDRYALYEIKHKFGGSIKRISGSNALKYKLLNLKGLRALVQDVNGLIRNPVRLLQLYRVCENYNIKLLEPKPLTYYNGWFSGFVDSDGSVHIDEKLGQIIICVTQKNKLLLEPLQVLFGGRIEILKSKEAFQYSVYRKTEVLKLIDSYFQIYPLKTHKAATKLNLIKEFYLLKDYRDLCIKGIEKYNKWVWFKDKWDKI